MICKCDNRTVRVIHHHGVLDWRYLFFLLYAMVDDHDPWHNPRQKMEGATVRYLGYYPSPSYQGCTVGGGGKSL